MLVEKKIAWQKYEDVIEEQINSPILKIVARSIQNNEAFSEVVNRDEGVVYNDDEDEDEFSLQNIVIGVPEDLSNEVSLTANFDCWVGHTNFNITDSIRDRLNKMSGVEVLKICSRYRFFIGVGRMFKFTDVRKNIEDCLLEK